MRDQNERGINRVVKNVLMMCALVCFKCSKQPVGQSLSSFITMSLTDAVEGQEPSQGDPGQRLDGGSARSSMCVQLRHRCEATTRGSSARLSHEGSGAADAWDRQGLGCVGTSGGGGCERRGARPSRAHAAARGCGDRTNAHQPNPVRAGACSARLGGCVEMQHSKTTGGDHPFNLLRDGAGSCLHDANGLLAERNRRVAPPPSVRVLGSVCGPFLVRLGWGWVESQVLNPHPSRHALELLRPLRAPGLGTHPACSSLGGKGEGRARQSGRP